MSEHQAMVERVARAIDPAYHLLPPDQVDRVFGQKMCDIDPEFLGFTDIYFRLRRSSRSTGKSLTWAAHILRKPSSSRITPPTSVLT
jgi:hypothetical protein